ncbi:MAG: V-type ATP synthase subunit E family protein [Candidatus Omnitrophica bacterium]|nr:V-type ATP synthase subunit E family protein [Candidatus Omnitrophota bacterium]
MSEDLKGLIEKIQQEGINAAQARAQEIEEEARKYAKKLIEDARIEADKMLEQAKEQISLAQAGSEVSLKQAARNTLIALRQQITSMLHNLITLEVRRSLSNDELLKIIVKLLSEYREKGTNAQIIISLNKENLEGLQQSLLAQLKGDLKSKIILKASDEVKAGFIISYDAGKSAFNFTDEALAEYISAYLDPKLDQILKNSLKSQGK